MGRHTNRETGTVTQTMEFIPPTEEQIEASAALDYDTVPKVIHYGTPEELAAGGGIPQPPVLPFTDEATSGDVFPKVDRVEIIDETGRAFVEYYKPAGVYFQLQDDERTLKLFAGKPQPRTGSVV